MAFAFAAGGQDITPPRLVSASTLDGFKIGVCFSEPMNSAGLAAPTNYTVRDGTGLAPVTNVLLRPGGDTVALSVSRAVSGSFSVTASNLMDLAGNAISPGQAVGTRDWSAGLATSEIGVPTPPGDYFTCTSGVVTVQAAAGQITSGGFDRFSYLYLTRTNDLDVAVRIDALADTGDLFPDAGLMVRDSLGADSAMLAAAITPTNGANLLISRIERGDTGATSFFYWQRTTLGFPVWLRVKRTGAVFSWFTSADGSTWSLLGNPVRYDCLPSALYVGLATLSASGVPALATYREFGDTRLSPNAVVQIVRSPGNISTEEHLTASLSVTASVANATSEELHYQWQATTSPGSGAFTNIAFASQRVYTTPPLHLADSGTRFRAVVGVSGHAEVISATARLTVNADATGPRVVSAKVGRSLREVFITFNEALQEPGATTPANYRVAGHTVTNVSLLAGSTSTVVALGERVAPGSDLQVSITNVTDLASHPVVPSPAVVLAHAPELTRNFAVQELYYCLPGGQVSDLTQAPKFPYLPDAVSYVPLLEGPAFFTDFYGTRLSGFLVPPVTGNYQFWMSSDDAGEFWLSTDDDPAHLVKICSEPEWDGYREFNSSYTTANRSSSDFPDGLPLAAGQPYAFQALSKEAAGGDHLSVAWQIPGSSPATNGSGPIPGAFLASLVDPGFATLKITQQPSNLNYAASALTGGSPHTLLAADFRSGTGGFTATFEGAPEGGWIHNPLAGGWTAMGSEAMPGSTKMLTSPPLTITRAGEVLLRFAHRFSFHGFRVPFDGGQVRVSVNNGPFLLLSQAAFLTNGYPGYIFGLHALDVQWGFGGQSMGYELGTNLTTVASLGNFAPGDTLAVQFIGAWDIGSLALQPNWLIRDIDITEGNRGALPARFSARASALQADGQAQTVFAQWQRDCGGGFADLPGANDPDLSFVPGPTDDGCRFRCMFSAPGISAPTDSALLTLGFGVLTIERTGATVTVRWNGVGQLQNAAALGGAWANVPGATSPYTVNANAANSFFRLMQP